MLRSLEAAYAIGENLDLEYWWADSEHVKEVMKSGGVMDDHALSGKGAAPALGPSSPDGNACG